MAILRRGHEPGRGCRPPNQGVNRVPQVTTTRAVTSMVSRRARRCCIVTRSLVSDKELSWRFGPGFWTYRLPLGDIETVAVVRNRWWNGFGIRMASGFRLYNVSGLDAVELHLKSHDIRRIGTDDPQGLANALQSLPRNK
jgi:hypothetical protein